MRSTAKALAIVPSAAFVALFAAAATINLLRPHRIDFLSFWAAARLSLAGHGAAAYDVAAHHAVENGAVHFAGLLPFPYPPPFLFFVSIFGAAPFSIAFILWTVATATFFVAASGVRARVAFAHPCAAFNAIIGQNGFLTAGIFLGGLRLLSRPLLGGALLGLLVIKPHLGVLVPVALVAGRQWRALAAATASAGTAVFISILVYGLEAWHDFAKLASSFGPMLAEGRWHWSEIASVYALARWFGPGHAVATIAQAVAAIAAIVATFAAWRRDRPAKIATVAAATALVSPYFLTYDATLLVAPFAVLLKRRPFVAGAVWLLCFLPALGNSFGYYAGPNTIPIAAGVALVALLPHRHEPSASLSSRGGSPDELRRVAA